MFLIMQEAQTMVCYSRQSPQQVLFHMYNAVSIAELKGYAMMQFSWMILRNYGKGLLLHTFLAHPKCFFWSFLRLIRPHSSIH